MRNMDSFRPRIMKVTEETNDVVTNLHLIGGQAVLALNDGSVWIFDLAEESPAIRLGHHGKTV